MPITTSAPITVFDQPAFHLVDEVVTGIAFDVHNQFGRYLDERLYQNEFEKRFERRELKCVREMAVTVSFADFAKHYYIDFLVNQGVIVETKTVEALSPAHRAQTLNYLFLCGLHHGTLLNLRSERAQREFVSTTLTPADRKNVTYDRSAWKPITEQCKRLEEVLAQLLHDWGACLDPVLYRAALTHFLGGESQVLRDVSILSDGRSLGYQQVHMLTDDIAFSVTTSVHRPDIVLEHHRRFLAHTKLKAMQWINMNRMEVMLYTITR